jgi:hypothetical protein
MTLLYLTTVGMTYFIRAGMGRDFEDAPPLVLFESLQTPLTLTLTPFLRPALWLSFSPLLLLRLSFLLNLPLSLTLLRVTLL